MPQLSERATLQREDRSFHVAPLELREGAGAPTFAGYASTVDQPYTVTDMFGDFTETMVQGAFTRSLAQKDDVRLLVNHTGVPLARTKSGTLTLREDPHLYAEAELDGTNPTVQEVRSAMLRGDLDQMSVGFRVLRQEWNEDYTDRQILEARLFDVSVVTAPANPFTSASLRSLDELVQELTVAREVDEAQVRRAIAHLESLISTREEEPVADFYLDRITELWDKRIDA
jgi:HK97 family phage prohead protease